MTTEAGKGRNVRYTIEGCDNSHDWRHPLGGRPVLVNGLQRTVEKVCRVCLVLESSPLAEQPCDRSRLLPPPNPLLTATVDDEPLIPLA